MITEHADLLDHIKWEGNWMAITNDISSRQRDFTGAMLDIYRRTLQEVGHRASFILDMVNSRGGLETAISLIYALHPSSGYNALHEKQRLDLTVEALVLHPKWNDMFNDEDRQVCLHSVETTRV